ncbi:unnamed protein product (macronuclear) [Paramecium tetraurelia]|uniref:protein-serine/threonine phosphatase n=1 Tax=Paramecium tetraurelia TaxID=5888 RepID=A0E1R5_PARTE|nr:uncharacterized protein GSPATT00022403001 [Paramecium tetraurelia]CAK89232.1 unnamed protein product [Paramecium tetraurelia]|eukprot:XP_001456629.1 hypothetical protein (macronuclear) [Paramecium tetraurelia strain d4-2]
MGGVYLSSPNRSKNTTIDENKTFIYAASAVQGWRRSMEDTHIFVCDLVPNVSLFGIFDGHGGADVAIFVQRHFTEELLRNNNFKDQNFEDALQETFLKMDELMFAEEGQLELQQIKNTTEEGAYQTGCTANVALFFKNTLYVANVGDSRSVLCRNNTNCDLSNDHKPVILKEKQRIESAGGFVDEGRINGNLNLSRALGDRQYKQNSSLNKTEQLVIAFPDIEKIELTQKDKFLLMGCDGIFDQLSHLELLQFINNKLGNQPVTPQLLGRVAEDLLDHLIAPGISSGVGCDNMTIIIIYLK